MIETYVRTVTTANGAPLAYVRVDALPPEWRQPFAAWIRRQTRPVIDSEIDPDGKPAMCAYDYDFGHWLAGVSAGVNPEALD